MNGHRFGGFFMRIALAAAALACGASLAAEVTVMSGGAVKSAFTDAAATWQKASGNPVSAKATLGEGGYIAEKVARGEVELVIHSVTEIAPVAGVTLIGLLPPELQKTTIYSGVVMKGAKSPKQAQALLDYLASPEGRKAFLDRGYTAP